MNEKAIQDAYEMFKSGGYSGSIDDYKQLISTNENALKDSYEIFKGGGYSQDINSFKTLMGLKKKSDWGSTLGSGSSASQKTERKATKEIAKTKDLRNVADKGSEIFTGYPGKEKNQYEFSNGNWYELNPEVEKTIKKSKESYVPVGGLPMGGGMFVNPSGEGQDFAKPGTSKNSLDAIKNVPKKRVIKNEARIKALNKQFGKNAIAPIPSKAPLKKAQKTEEQDYFTGAFGNVLRGFDNIVPIGIGDFVDDMARSVASGYRQGTVAQEADDLLLKGSKSTPEQIQKFINANKNSQQMLPSAEMQDYQKIYEEEGKGFWGVVKGIVKNPSVIGELMTSSLVSMATNTDALKAGAAGVATGATYGAATGATAGGVGAIPGSVAGAVSSIPYAFGLASSVVEMGATFGELLTEELKGKELTKENVKAILENPEKLQSIRNKAIARGVIIGAADALTGKLASGVGAKIISKSAAKSATGAVTKSAVVKSTAAGAAIEAAGGSAGEATARGAIGQDMDVSEIALEGIAELPGGIRSTIQARLAKPSYKVNGAKATSEQVDELINTMTPDDLAKTKIEIKNDYEGREFKMQDKIVTNSIKEQVKQGNPELNEPSLNAITQLEKDLRGLEGNTTQTGKDKAAAIRTQIKNIQENQLQEEATAEASIPEEISSLKDDEPFTKRVKTLEEIPEEFRDRAQLSPLTEVETRKNIFGLPIGKKGSKLVGGGYTYTLTGKEAKDYAIQEQAAGQVPVQPTTTVGEEVVQGESTAEPQVLTEEGKVKEINSFMEIEKSSIEDYLSSAKKNLEDATSEEDRSYYKKTIDEKKQELELFNSNPIEYAKSKLEYFSEKDENGELYTPFSYNMYKDMYDALSAEATTESKAEEVAPLTLEEEFQLLAKEQAKAPKAKRGKGKTTRAPKVETPVVKAEAPKEKGELPVMSWSKVEEYDDAVIRSMKEIQYGKLKPLIELGKRTTVAQKEEIKTIQAKIATAEKILDKRANKIKREAQRVEKAEPIDKGTRVRGSDNNNNATEFSIIINEKKGTANVQLKKRKNVPLTRRATPEANLTIQTDENKKRFVETKNKTKVYIDEAITPAKVESTKAKVTTKSNVKAAPVKEKVKKEFIIDGKEYTEEEAIEIGQNNSRYPNYGSKMEYNGSDPQAKEFVNRYNRDSSPYNRNGNLKGTYIQEKLLEALGSMNFRKFGNLYRKHIDPYFSRASNEKSQGGWVDKNLSFRELAGYIIGDASPSYFEEASFRAFAKEAGIEIPLAPVIEVKAEPTKAKVTPATTSVKALFESNPELANEVYEALGIKDNVVTKTNKKIDFDKLDKKWSNKILTILKEKYPEVSFEFTENTIQFIDDPMVFMQLSNKMYTEFKRLLTKKRPDLAERGLIEMFLDDISELSDEFGTKENKTRLEKLALHWIINGSVILPEDGAKVVEAEKIASKKKLDAFSYSSPNEIIEKFAEESKKEKVDPDTLSSFTNKKDIGDGVVIYDVDNSDLGQEQARIVLDTHFGEKSNPWCLLYKDADGSLTRAKEHWFNTYPGPKKIAFQNGKLIAFYGGDLWWDRLDNSSDGIPIVRKIKDDSLKRKQLIIVDSKDANKIIDYGNKTLGNKQNGEYKEWDKNDNLLLDENYKNGEQDGKSIKYNSRLKNGQIEMESNYKDGLANGKTIVYHNNGEIHFDMNFKDGLLDGKRISKFTNGQIELESNYKNGKQDGKETRYYRSGQIELESNYKDGKKDGKYTQYHENYYRNEQSGELNDDNVRVSSNYKNGEIDGTSFTYYENGVIQYVTNYKEGKRDGKSFNYYSNGQIHYDTDYKNGFVDGLLKSYGSKGNLQSETNHKNGNFDGKSIDYYDNGQIKSEKNYKNGRRDGKQISYYTNGQIHFESNYKDDVKDGIYKYYFKEGPIYEESNYKDGERYGKTIYYYSNGQIKSEENYQQRNKEDEIIGQANTEAMTVLVNALKQKKDTIPHEYAHIYIAMFRDTPIVQEGIKRFGSEEKLVQAIGEQVVQQKGEAYNWWKKFTNFILKIMSDQQVVQVLTDSFLERADLTTYNYTKYSKTQAQNLFSEYIKQNPSGDIDGFREFVFEKQTKPVVKSEAKAAPVKEEAKVEPVVEDNTFVYKMSKEIMPSGKGKWEADFEIIDNRDGKNLGEGAKWAVYNRIGGEMVDALSKQDAADIIKNAPSYGGEMWGEGKTIDFTDLDKKEQDNHREEFNKQKADKAAPVVEEVKAAPVAEKVKAPAPAKESTDNLMSAINSIKEDIKETTEEIEKAKAEAKEKIEKINAENIDLDDLEADIKEIQDDLKKDLDGLKLDLDRHVKALKEEVKKLEDLDAKATENKKTLLTYINEAIATLNGLKSTDKSYGMIDAGISVGILKKILQGIRLGVIAGNTINASIRAMAKEYRGKHKNKKITIAEFTKEIQEYLRNTFVDQKTNEQDIQEARDKFVEIREAVRKAKLAVKTKSQESRKKAFDAIREMLTGKVKNLTAVQMKSIMLRLARFNVFSQTQYDKFIDYVDKVIGIADYDAKVAKANENRKNAKKNLPKLGDISSDLLDPLSRVLSINAKLIPSDVFESYAEIVEMLSKRDAVLKLNKRADLNESLDKIIESIESNEQRISDLKDLYDNFAGKTADYAETLDEMLKVGIINQSEHKLMKTFKSKIQAPKVKDKMTEQQIADEKVELINEINNTTITLDEIVGDEFRLERDLVKKLQALLKNKKTLESLNNKDLKDLLRVIDNINNGFVSNATQEMVEKLNFIEKSILLESSIPKTFKVIIARINQSLGKLISKRINVAPLFNIDQQLGDFKTKNIFNSVFNESAKAQQGYQSAITLIQDELDKIERGIATSFENEPNKIILSQFKMMVYMMQLEYNSNPTKQEGSKKQVHQAMKTLDETIKFAKQNSEKSGYNDLDIAQMEFIKKEFAKDGEIDIDKLYNSFNESEKNGLKKLQEINDRMTKFATYTATVINGNKIKPLKNYISYTVINESDILSASETTEQINNINANMTPGTVSKNLEERDGKVHPVYLNPFYATNSSSRSVLLNYHMTEPVRTARKTLRNAKTLLEAKDATTKEQYDILNAITEAYNTATRDLLESNFTQSNKILEFLKRQGYRAILASGTRAAAELSSNVIFVLANNKFDMARGLSKQIKNIEEKDKKSIMTNLGATVSERLYPKSSINSPFVEMTTNQNRSSKIKNTQTGIRNGVIQAWNETAKKYVLMPVAGLADYVISKPDQLVMRPLWFGAFSRAFEKEAGIKPDFDKIMENNEEYMDKYKDALEKATTMADKQVITSGSSTNAYMGILQNVVREGDKVAAWAKEFNRFMNKFTVQEYYTSREGVKALVGNGTISRSDGAHVLAAVTLRMTSYFVFTRLFSEGLAVVARSLGFGGDDDDDDKTAKQKISQGILSSITTLVFGRYFGNFIRTAENALIELVNKEYGEAIGLRDGEYDPYEDAIQFNQLQEGKVDKLTDLTKVMAGPLSPVIGTAELAYKLATSSKPEGERAKLTRAKELYRRLPLEIGGLAGVVPFYKDVRKIVMEGVYKELKKETKEKAVKKEAEAKADAEEIVQKTSILKEMMDSGRYTKEGIKKELRKIKDPEYRKAEKKIEEDMVKAILDQQTIKYSNKQDFEKREKEKAKIAFKMYDKRREESLKILNELKNRMKALEYDEEYIVKGSFGSNDKFGSDSFGSDSFGGDEFGGDEFGEDDFGEDD